MLPEFGLFFLIVALLAACVQAAFLVRPLSSIIAPCLRHAAWFQAFSITMAFATLINLRLASDFTVLNVVMHSNLTLPTLYKITGSWGNHEGSMLLWALVLASFGAAVAWRAGSPEAEAFRWHAVAFQAMLSVGVLCFILFTSNPFARIFPPPSDGDALNPLLQDVALALHPPLLYVGYVGFSIVFAYALAALWLRRIDDAWAQSVHPWILLSWSFLTLGIGLGSWWAYRVLGWGGFWFWDPVENASLLPWLSGTALMHAHIVLRKRGLLRSWVLLLSILTFGLSLLGTFLVRSGVLTSVHSFASDPARGSFILAFTFFALGGALVLYALRLPTLSPPAPTERMAPLSREGMIVINNLFVLTACATVMLGTLYPIAAEWIDGSRITVGPRYFNLTFLPLMVIPLIFAGLTPFLPWAQARLRSALSKAQPAAMAAFVAAALVLSFTETRLATAAFGLGISAWLFMCSLSWLRRQQGRRHAYSVFLGHAGVAALLAGLTGAALWHQERELAMSVGESAVIGGYTMTLKGFTMLDEPDHSGLAGHFILTSDGETIARLQPEYRLNRIRKSGSSIADIYSTPWYDVYAVVGEMAPDGERIAVRLYWRPLMNWFWLGFIGMAAGGFFNLLRRKV